ncbi:uncharacterized protein BJX67DRAFT_167389 [Aspergillus lucknowensis]|uniref:F-box domain-containing protein n=1 Tax=Aspergillus lucknowensis TaxID=176173 RepID=A0ABR4M539_9EURO
MASSPPSLGCLPVELLTQLGSYLCPHCAGRPSYDSQGQESLSRLTRICRRLRDILQPFVFHSFTHIGEAPPRLLSFLYAIAARPELAQAVTTIAVSQPQAGTEFTDHDRRLLEQYLACLRLPYPPTNWPVNEYKRNSILEIIVFYCQRLETLDFVTLYHLNSYQNPLHHASFTRLRGPSMPTSFGLGVQSYLEYDILAPVLGAARTLKSLALPTITGFKPGNGVRLPVMRSLRVLNFRASLPALSFVQALLAHCTQLQKFTLHLRLQVNQERDRSWTVLDAFAALLYVKDTLQELTFEASLDTPFGELNQGCISTLTQFKQLRSLKVNGRCLRALSQSWTLNSGTADMSLFATQLLPPTITNLTIWDPHASLIPALFSFAREKVSGQYPHLTTVLVAASPTSRIWMPRSDWAEHRDQLEEEFEKAGVTISLNLPNAFP